MVTSIPRSQNTTILKVDGRTFKGSVVVSQDWITFDVLSDPYPKMEWEHTDSAGHVHRFTNERGDVDTLTKIVTSAYYCHDCRDEHEEHALICKKCGEEVEPEWGDRGPTTKSVPGLTSIQIKVLVSLPMGSRHSVEYSMSDGHTYMADAVVDHSEQRLVAGGYPQGASLLTVITEPQPIA